MYAETSSSTHARARACAPQPVRSSDPTADLQCLFKAYDAACFDFDADAVAGFYDLPCLLSSPGGQASFTARGEVRAAMARLFTLYRQRGLVSASIVDLKLKTLGHDFARAEVRWSLSNARGMDITGFASSYTLRQADRRWRIAHAVSLDDGVSPADLAPRGPVLSLRPR